jgi:four helix bundle protein
MARFDPEKIAVYALARRHNRCLAALIAAIDTRGQSDLVAQVRASAASIPANILEATGEWRDGKRLHYLMIAKGSTWESWAHIDTMVDFGIAGRHQIADIRALQNQITALLITMVRNLETRIAEKARQRPPARRKSEPETETEIEPQLPPSNPPSRN